MSDVGGIAVTPLPTGLLERGDDLPGRLEGAWRRVGVEPVPGDVLLVASKAVATWEGRVVDMAGVEAGRRARELSRTSGLPPAFCQVVIDESDLVLGAVPGALLTLARGILVANGGADMSNVPEGHAVLWPQDAWRAARGLRRELEARGAEGVAVVVVDSHVQPLRLGTVGMALGWSGIAGVEDVRGRSDLFGRPLHVTRRNVADMLASLGALVMGESDEGVPAALVRGLAASVPPGGDQGPGDVLVPPPECLFAPVYEGRLVPDDEGGA